MRINVHAGHNPDGKTACGAIGFIQESTEARKVKNEVISLLRQQGHTVYDCTCDNGTDKDDILVKIVKACNAHNADLDVSIHFNSCVKDLKGDGKTTGTEVFLYNASSKAKTYAEKVCAAIAGLGFRNRGIRYNPNLYVLKKTTAPAMLIECCFVDDKDDVQLYSYQKMAEAIVYGITGQKLSVQELKEEKSDPEASAAGAETATGNKEHLYRVQVGSYSVASNAKAMQERLKKAGFDAIIVNA